MIAVIPTVKKIAFNQNKTDSLIRIVLVGIYIFLLLVQSTTVVHLIFIE